MLLLIDNYDSFTYNLFQYLCELGQDVHVVRNDKTTIDAIDDMHPKHIVLSPGPSTPLKAGISNDIISHFAGIVPILGVCLGHQCIGYTFGATVSRAKAIMHGKSSLIHHNGRGIFAGIPDPCSVIRYHSLAIQRETVPDCLEITAFTDDDTIMGIRHREFPIEGIQFHPESFMTPMGKTMLQNFINGGNSND
ncbi:MAG TPA: anthranilate/aminodeoxychorismate synthase component II [Dehalococcoidia bacterium]|nr:anthranilate/aminodeoxychorismate synthase component II [Dehalococcoidia bacterium]